MERRLLHPTEHRHALREEPSRRRRDAGGSACYLCGSEGSSSSSSLTTRRSKQPSTDCVTRESSRGGCQPPRRQRLDRRGTGAADVLDAALHARVSSPATTLDVVIGPILAGCWSPKPLLVARTATEIPPRAVGPSEPLVEDLVQEVECNTWGSNRRTSPKGSPR